MTKEFRLPDIGEGVHEGEITKWLVKEGDPIREEQLFVEVMTDKVTVQLPSPFTGKVLRLLAKEGEVVLVGNPIIVIGESGEAAPTHKETVPGGSAGPLTPPPSPPPPPPEPAGGEVLATPAVRRLARELGIDLAAVRGAGPRGRVTEEDVRAAKAAPTVSIPSVAAKPAPTGAREERIAVRGVRRLISDRMHKSRMTAAHFTYMEEVDMT